MKLTKRGFLQSIGSTFLAGKLSDKTTAKALDLDPCSVPSGWPDIHNTVQAGPINPDFVNRTISPAWRAKHRVEVKGSVLRSTDPGLHRSGQFTTHEQKKARWLMKREYRRYMWGVHPEDRKAHIGTIQQWKATQSTLNGALTSIKEQLRGLEAIAEGAALAAPWHNR